eukprot:jgi/Orpsp1_1/1177728/evm.model.c7180000062603.2
MTDPGLPHPQPTRSFWLIDNPLSNHRTTVSLPGCADIVILGAGITGMCLVLLSIIFLIYILRNS